MKKIFLLLLLLAGLNLTAQPSDFLTGNYLLENTLSRVGPVFAGENFSEGAITITVGSTPNLRVFQSQVMPLFGGYSGQITLDLSNNLIQLVTLDSGIGCSGNNIVFDSLDPSAATTWNLTNGDSFFEVFYLEDTLSSCIPPSTAAFSLTKLPSSNTFVPDDNFEQALINLGLDNIIDDLVLTSSISSLTALDLSNQGIIDFTGIEDFIALESLDISGNPNSVNINLNSLPSLKVLNASDNNLRDILPSNTIEELNLSGNSILNTDFSTYSNLKVLNLSRNGLISEPLLNGSMETLILNDNRIQNLDLTSEPFLTELHITDNSALVNVDFTNGNNTALTILEAFNLPSLICFKVSDKPFMDANFGPSLDPNRSFRTTCNPLPTDDFKFTKFISSPFNLTFLMTLSGEGAIEVEWGDGQSNVYQDPVDQQISHTYAFQSTFPITVKGRLEAVKFDLVPGLQLTDLIITQWGSSQWKTMESAFENNLVTILANDTPNLSQVSSLYRMFYRARLSGDLSNWDVSYVTDMSEMFLFTSNFNQPLDSWDVSNVLNMSAMFKNSTAFNQPLNSWDVSNVLSMNSMFEGARNFNQPLDNWNVSRVSDMNSMFSNSDFNQPIGNWDVSSVRNMGALFASTPFNQSIDSWNVSLNTIFSAMFANNTSFNQPLGNWNVLSGQNFTGMFRGCSSFNQPLNDWDISQALSSIVIMDDMFKDAIMFDQPLNNWQVLRVRGMEGMFDGSNFNQDISNWDTSSVTRMSEMFANTSFNQPLNDWDVSSVIDFSGMFQNNPSFNQPLSNWIIRNSGINSIRMDSMFESSTAFNQPIESWDISYVTGLAGLFENATSFNQDLSSWTFNPNAEFTFRSKSMLKNSGLNQVNYDKLIERLVFSGLTNKTLEADGLEYCFDFTRDVLIQQRGWGITGDFPAASCPDNAISGEIILDFNNNGCDSSDPRANALQLIVSDGTESVTYYTDNQGLFTFNARDGVYTITPIYNASVYISTPSDATITVSNGNVNDVDFCLSSVTLIDDLDVVIMPILYARPGFDADYKLIFKNNGNTRLSGSVSLSYQDDLMDFLSSTPASTSSNTGSLTWNFTDLDPFESREIYIEMNLNTPTDPTFPLNSGDILNFMATISPITNDATPSDNTFILDQTVINSFDPNDKTCLQGNVITPSMVGDYVHYRIRFENEGTASAVNVRIVDFIDTSVFDVSSLVPLSSSHDHTTQITEGNRVEFIFDNINLPNTAPASQGYVLFKIKTLNSLTLGDSFSNQAEIYFDFNFPIITNLETTIVDVPNSVSSVSRNSVTLYPNPASDRLNLSSKHDIEEYQLFDIRGKRILSEQLKSPSLKHSIELPDLNAGLYLLQVNTTAGQVTEKLVVE